MLEFRLCEVQQFRIGTMILKHYPHSSNGYNFVFLFEIPLFPNCKFWKGLGYEELEWGKDACMI